MTNKLELLKNRQVCKFAGLCSSTQMYWQWMEPKLHSLLSAHHLIGAYFLTTESDKHMRLLSRHYGICVHSYTHAHLLYWLKYAEGSIDFSALLDLLNQSSQTAVLVKAEVFQTILRIFQLDSSQKGVFRDVCGFHYLISVLASLIGSLAPRRSEPWIGGEQEHCCL